MPPIAIAVAGLAIAAGGAVMAHVNAKKQAKFLRKSASAQRAQDNMKAARERREAIRSARIASGNVLQASVNQGVQGSDASLGGLGSINQQLNQGLSFLDGQNALAGQASRAETKAGRAAVSAQAWGSVSDFGMAVFGSAGSLGKKPS